MLGHRRRGFIGQAQPWQEADGREKGRDTCRVVKALRLGFVARWECMDALALQISSRWVVKGEDGAPYRVSGQQGHTVTSWPQWALAGVG